MTARGYPGNSADTHSAGGGYLLRTVVRKPRLLVLITLAEAGGAQESVSLLLPALAEQFDVTLAARGPGPLAESAREAGVPFVELQHVRRAVHPWHDLLGLIE